MRHAIGGRNRADATAVIGTAAATDPSEPMSASERAPMCSRRRVGGMVAMLLAAICLPRPGWSADFPSKPVKLITGGTPGSVTDSIARPLAQRLAAVWGQPVIVENKPGAGGILAMELVAKAPPDGYTLGIASTSQLVLNRYLFKHLPYDPQYGLTPIVELVRGGAAIVAHASFPGTSLSDLLALAKKDPGGIRYAVPQLGSPPHVIALTLWRAANVEVESIVYRNPADALTTVLQGEIPILIDAPALVAQHVHKGALKALAVTGRERSALLPETPTLSESGFAEVHGDAWIGVVGPAHMPAQTIDEIGARVAHVLRSADLSQLYESAGWRISASTSSRFAATIQEDDRFWGKAIMDAGIKLE